MFAITLKFLEAVQRNNNTERFHANYDLYIFVIEWIRVLIKIIFDVNFLHRERGVGDLVFILNWGLEEVLSGWGLGEQGTLLNQEWENMLFSILINGKNFRLLKLFWVIMVKCWGQILLSLMFYKSINQCIVSKKLSLTEIKQYNLCQINEKT